MENVTTEMLKQLFPVATQTTDDDRKFLLRLQSSMAQLPETYRYLEIGSFLGGSLVPFLKDKRCSDILSVDDRGLKQPDERGFLYDYAGVTAQTMVTGLQKTGLETSKLRTHDGSIDSVAKDHGLFDLVFIDGEHTDDAAFRDLLFSLDLLKADSVVLFHDSNVVFRAIKLAAIYLKKSKKDVSFFKAPGKSSLTGFFMGSLSQNDAFQKLKSPMSIEVFAAESEVYLLKQQLKSRVRLRPSLTKLYKFNIVPPAVRKAYED